LDYARAANKKAHRSALPCSSHPEWKLLEC
jgi:hypothetical protein